MKFRLTYEGPLRSSNRDRLPHQIQPLATHKHAIRRAFHTQLKELWRTNKFLSTYRRHPDPQKAIEMRPLWRSEMWFGPDDEELVSFQDYIAERFRENGYRFVPLVCEEFGIACALEILFLRRDPPGSAIQAGDIDNRVKTLIDALRKPNGPQELAGAETPGEGEDPFFVLLEDDKLIDHFSVETDTLLSERNPGPDDDKLAKVVVTVTVRPYLPSYFNLAFV